VVALPSGDGSIPARTAECTHPALAAEDEGNFKRFLLMLTDSAQLTRHRDLTVSTDVGMMHYNLLAPHGLLFMAVTIPDMLQSDAFRFLEKLRNRFLREFPQVRAHHAIHTTHPTCDPPHTLISPTDCYSWR
jgi:hypothetical protein